MPSIAGIISRRPGGECRELVERMAGAADVVAGGTGTAVAVPELGVHAAFVGFGAPAAGGGVSWSGDGQAVLVMCGELRGDNRVGSPEDVSAVDRYGGSAEEFVRGLNGLFSGLLVDRAGGEIALFNDRYGVGKLYTFEAGGDLYFASEARALLAVVPEARRFDREGVAELLAVGCTTGERSLFAGVRRLPGGALWVFDRDDRSERRYFQASEWEGLEPLGLDTYCERLEAKLGEIVPKYCAGAGGAGVALTAGLDTRMLMACRGPGGGALRSYTFAGPKATTLDGQLAKAIADECSIPHEILRIEAGFFDAFPQLVDRAAVATDGCVGLLAAHEVYFNARARSVSPVRVTGNYGSEVLRGVSTFKPRGLPDALIDGGLRPRVREFESRLARWKGSPITFAAFREVPWKRFGIQAAGASQLVFRTPYLDNELVRLAYQAPAGTGRSGEPALRLIRSRDPGLASIPTDKGNFAGGRFAVALMRKYRRLTFKLDYFYNDGMPHGLGRFERVIGPAGFGIGLLGQHKFLHYRRWFQEELAGYLRSAVRDPGLFASGMWNRQFVEAAAEHHIAGRRNYLGELGTVLTLGAVERQFFGAIATGGTVHRNLAWVPAGGGAAREVESAASGAK